MQKQFLKDWEKNMDINFYDVLYQIEEKCNQIIIYRALHSKRDYMNFEWN